MEKTGTPDILAMYPKPQRVRPYEMVFLVHPDLDEQAVQSLTRELQERVQRIGGKVTYVNFWGKRPLAYPIRKRREAYYVLLHLNAPAGNMHELHRYLRYKEAIVRYLIVRRDE